MTEHSTESNELQERMATSISKYDDHQTIVLPRAIFTQSAVLKTLYICEIEPYDLNANDEFITVHFALTDQAMNSFRRSLLLVQAQELIPAETVSIQQTLYERAFNRK